MSIFDFPGCLSTRIPFNRAASRNDEIVTTNGLVRLLMFLVVLSGLLGVSPAVGQDQDPFAAGVRPTDPLTPEEERATFRLPPGFEIQLVASEPDIFKPLNMAFDAKGRLWVTDSTEYPYPVPLNQPGRDSVKILEDTNGDGRADKVTTFADGLNIPIGIYPYEDGCLVFSIPYIWKLRDTDGDDIADERIKLYGPMGYERDTHGMNNSFSRGFDGWLYACHGFNNHTTVSGADGHTIQMQSGNTYRMRLDGSRVEHFTWGQVNPFGMTFDALGNLFTSDCHSKPIYQLLRGGYYPSFGKPDDGLGFVPPMMDHLHGSTAIAGIASYTGENFPPEFRGNIFTGNVMTSRVNRDSLQYAGSTITAIEEPDFLSTTDPWFRPVDVQMGPDGALYVADFYNKIIGHYEVPLDHPGRDRYRGRIWRIVYTGNAAGTKPVAPLPNLGVADVSTLIEALQSPNLTLRTLATSELTDRVGAAAGAKPVREAFFASTDASLRSHALWILKRFDALDAEVTVSAAHDDDRMVRIHILKALAETAEWNTLQRDLVLDGLHDDDAFTRRAAADALGQHSDFDHISPLLSALAVVDPADNHLRHTLRMALRNQLRDDTSLKQLMAGTLSEADSRIVAGVCVAVTNSEAATFLLKHVQRVPEERATLARYLQHAARYASADDSEALAEFARSRFQSQIDFQLQLLSSINNGLRQRGVPPGVTLRAWGHDLAGELLASTAESLAWNNTPIEGKRSSANPWVLQQRRSADGNSDAEFFSSLPRGEQLTGTLRSVPFTIPPTLSFYAAGHIGFPKRPVFAQNFIRLRDAITHEQLAESTPPRNDLAQKIEWDLRTVSGRRGYLEIVDGDDGGAYAWLAVGRLEPAVVAWPSVSPRVAAERQQAAAEIVITMGIRDLKPALEERLSEVTLDMATREAIARALFTLDPDSGIEALLPLIGDLGVPNDLRNQICAAIVSRETARLRGALVDAIRRTPQRLQASLAQTLAGNFEGATTLLKLVRDGHASPRLLQRASVQERLLALNRSEIDQELKQLTAQLPSENEAIQKLIGQRLKTNAHAKTALERGAEVFKKNCAICHQLEGQGPLIGPQLDGIGNRGLERVVEDVLDPNRNVDVAFRSTTVVMQDGKIYTGLVRRQEGATLTLADNKGKEFSLDLEEIDEQVKSPLSLMPDNVAEIIPEADFHNLIAFLLTKRGPKPAESAEK